MDDHQVMGFSCSMIAVVLISLCLAIPHPAEAVTNEIETTVSIPVANLDIEHATATISVFRDSPSPLNSLLRACQDNLPEFLSIEDREIVKELQAFCGKAERWTKKHFAPPVHELDTKGYIIRVPLKTPHQHIQAITWHAKDLDDAMTFVKMLRHGAVHSVTVFAVRPWDEDSSEPCTECPIKELVLHLSKVTETLPKAEP